MFMTECVAYSEGLLLFVRQQPPAHTVSLEKRTVGGSFVDSNSWVVSSYVDVLVGMKSQWRVPNQVDKQGKGKKSSTLQGLRKQK